MTTKEKVLETALQLFNAHGVENTSAKNIAAEINISDGNLRYHFRTKEDIIYHLYLRLVDDFNQRLNTYEAEIISLKSVYEMLIFVFTKLYEYKFLMIDFVAIMRKYPKIQAHYRQLYQYRKQQYNKFINTLIAEDIFRKDITIAQYHNMADHLTILSDFWISSAEVLYQEEENKKLEYYIQLVFSLLIPYLSRKGMYEYISLTDTKPASFW